MANCKLVVNISVRYKWLLMAINFPLVALGFKPVCPRFFLVVSGPRNVS